LIESSENLILNPSFEIQTEFGIPDSFFVHINQSNNDTRGASVLPDSHTSVHGYHSMKLRNPAPNSSNGSFVSLVSYHNPKLEPGVIYLASVWAKARSIINNNQVMFRLAGCGGSQDFVVTETWNMFVINCKLQEMGRCTIEITLLTRGVLNVDLLQLVPLGYKQYR